MTDSIQRERAVHTALVPQLSSSGITEDDLATSIRVLNAVARLDPKSKKRKASGDDGNGGDGAADGLSMYKQPNLRTFRKALSSCLSLHRQTMYGGKSEEEYYEQRLKERTLKRQKQAENAQQRQYVATTELRKGRVEKLEKLKQDCKEEEESKLLSYLVPDGHVDTASMLLLKDGNAGEEKKTDEQLLPKLRSCYVCKVRFRSIHHFYDQLCPQCAPFNFEKRTSTADMRGKVAVVTGSRVKIGFQICLKLLRAGCTVIATTRFPNNAVAAYRNEADFSSFKDRLHVYGLDLRDITGVEAFTRYLKGLFGDSGIDVIINNACQTIRRNCGYYSPLVDREQQLWTEGDRTHRDILRGCTHFERIRRRLVHEHKTGAQGNLLVAGPGPDEIQPAVCEDGAGGEDVAVNSQLISTNQSNHGDAAPFEATGLSHSAAMSQMQIVPEDVGVDEKVLPPGLNDINGQQLDLRTQNSWLLKMDSVSTPEMIECMFVNAIAPFVLNSRLQPLMETPENRPDRYIINVSAMEGKFYRYKTPNHPHTNMAKAAINMMTRTSSEDLAKKRIYMNAVDTGWINDENPLERAAKIAKTNAFQTPIDEIDAAARVLDPVFTGVNMDCTSEGNKRGKCKPFGLFFKDFRETEW